MSQDEAKNLFMAIQKKISDDTQELNLVNAQMQKSQRELRVVDLVVRELGKLEPNTPTYKSVGKMFLGVPQETLKEELVTKKASQQDTLAALEKKGKYLNRHIQDANNSLKDLLHKAK